LWRGEPYSRWDLVNIPSESVLRRFKTAAEQAAKRAGNSEAWWDFLDLLKREEHTFHPGDRLSSHYVGEILVTGESGVIPRVCEAAADYCEKRIPEDEACARKERFMAQAMDRFYGVATSPTEPIQVPTAAPPSPQGWSVVDAGHPVIVSPHPIPEKDISTPETIASQLSRLREESRLTLEQLAEQIGIDLRSVERHFAGKTEPRLKHIGAYERVFKKAIGRKVVISKMPGKRR
jgi:hypothetical protein